MNDITLPNVRAALLAAGIITQEEADLDSDSLIRTIVDRAKMGAHHAAIAAACALDGTRLPPSPSKRTRKVSA